MANCTYISLANKVSNMDSSPKYSVSAMEGFDPETFTLTVRMEDCKAIYYVVNAAKKTYDPSQPQQATKVGYLIHRKHPHKFDRVPVKFNNSIVEGAVETYIPARIRGGGASPKDISAIRASLQEA